MDTFTNTDSFLDRLRRETARATATNPSFRKTGSLRGLYSITLLHGTWIQVVLKPLGGAKHPANKETKFKIRLSASELPRANELTEETRKYFGGRLRFHPYKRLGTLKSFMEQLEAFYTETTQRIEVQDRQRVIVPDPRFSIKNGAEKTGYYSLYSKKPVRFIPVPGDDIVTTNIVVSLMPLDTNAGSAKIRNLVSVERPEYESILADGINYLEGKGFFKSTRQSPHASKRRGTSTNSNIPSPRIIEAKLLLKLEKLKKNRPDTYDTQADRHKGTFMISTGNPGKNGEGRITIQIRSPNDEIEARAGYAPDPEQFVISTGRGGTGVTGDLANHAKTFLEGIGFENREIYVLYNYDRPIEQNRIDLSTVKLIEPEKHYKSYLIQIVQGERSICISTGTNEKDKAEACLAALLNADGLPRMLAEGEPISQNALHAYLYERGLSKVKPYRKVMMFGLQEKLYGYLFCTSRNTNTKAAVKVTVGSTPDQDGSFYGASKKMFMAMPASNIDARLSRIMGVSKIILDGICDTGFHFTKPATQNDRTNGINYVYQTLNVALRSAQRLAMDVKIEPTQSPDGRFMVHVTPRRNFIDPLSEQEFPVGSLTLTTSSIEMARSFEINAHHWAYNRMANRSFSRQRYVPDPALVAECVGGAIPEGITKNFVAPHQEAPLPTDFMKLARRAIETKKPSLR